LGRVGISGTSGSFGACKLWCGRGLEAAAPVGLVLVLAPRDPKVLVHLGRQAFLILVDQDHAARPSRPVHLGVSARSWSG
jgi:hypothetical protein